MARCKDHQTYHYLPHTQQAHKNVVWETREEHLRQHEDVGRQGRLQHDWHVRRVKQLDGIVGAMSTKAVRFDGNLHSEALEIDDNAKDERSGHQVGQVGQVGAVELFPECTRLVTTSEQQVEKRNDGSLKLGSCGRTKSLRLHAFSAAGCHESLTSSSIDGGWTECTPNDALTDVGGNEERDPRAQTIALLQHLVQQNHNHASNCQLDNQQRARHHAKRLGFAVHACHHRHKRLSKSDDQRKHYPRTSATQISQGMSVTRHTTFLGSAEQSAILLQAVVDLDHIRPSQQLHHHARSDDGRDPKLHQRATVGCHDHTHPIQRIC